MSKVDSIMKQVGALSAEERAALISLLLARHADGDDSDAATGRRGLASLTASTRDEDWSAYYPESLRNRRGGRQ